MLTYPQKSELIDFLSNPLNWQNRFNQAFFDDKTRKWKSRSVDGYEIRINEAGTEGVILHEASGTVLTIDRTPERTQITDEAGRVLEVVYRNAKVVKGSGVTMYRFTSNSLKSLENDARVLPVPEFNLYVGVNAHGRSVYFDGPGLKAVFEQTGAKKDRQKHPGKYFHAVNLNPTAADAFGMALFDLMQSAKLVVARDMGIEPDIRAFNALDPAMTMEHLAWLMKDEWDPDWKGPWQWRPKLKKEAGDVSKLQKSWNDVTEFEGYFVAVPNQFYVERTDDGYRLSTTLDDKEAIWSQGQIFKKARDGETPPIRTITSRTAAQSLLFMLQKGVPVRDHRDREWSYILVHAKESAVIANKARDAMRDTFGLGGQHFATINFANGLCLMAMDCRALEQISAAYQATAEVVKLIREGSDDGDAMMDLIKKGADLKYIDPKAARAGRTLANIMAEAGNTALLDRLAKASGIHDVTFAAPEKPLTPAIL